MLKEIEKVEETESFEDKGLRLDEPPIEIPEPKRRRLSKRPGPTVGAILVRMRPGKAVAGLGAALGPGQEAELPEGAALRLIAIGYADRVDETGG